MDNLVRLLLRFLLVPLGYIAAVIAGACVLLIGEWRIGDLFTTQQPDGAGLSFVVGIVTAVAVLVLLLAFMWLIAAVGILFSEAFAVRSWMFHVANGAVSAFIGAQIFAPEEVAQAAGDSFYVIAAGLAAGLAYWLVAGSTAGFFKPILRSAADRAALPPPAERAGTPPLPPPP